MSNIFRMTPPALRTSKVLEPVATCIHSLQSVQGLLIDRDIAHARVKLLLVQHMINCALWELALVSPPTEHIKQIDFDKDR